MTKKSKTARQTLQALIRARQHVARITPARLVHALATLEEQAGIGYAPGIGESSIGKNRGVHDPTGEAATNATERELDDKERDAREKELAELVETINRLDYAAARAVKLMESARTHRPNEHQQLRNPGCESCARGELKNHAEAYQQVYARGLCSFCYEFEERYGVRPAFPIVMWHLDNLGRQVPKTLIRDHHPEEFRRYHAPRRAS